MNALVTSPATPPYHHRPPFQLGPDKTPDRKRFAVVPHDGKTRRAPRLFSMVMVAAALLVLAPYAHAQHASPPAGPSEKQKAKALEKQTEVKETDEAYKSTLKRIPDAKQNVDPWGNMRTTPAK
jgi:hypothetical protein